MPSIWDLPQQEPQRGPAMDEARRRAVAMLGLLGAGLPTSSELRTSVLYDSGKLDAMAGGPTRGEYRDAQRQKVANVALGLLGAIEPVWHGSPHKFTRFDLSKIRTGEGGLAYGHGAYLAENPSTANDYANKLAGVKNLRSLNYWDIQQPQAMSEQVAEAFRTMVADAGVTPSNWIKRSLKNGYIDEATAKELKNIIPKNVRPTGSYLYETRLRWPDPAREAADPLGPQHFLDYDVPFSKQPEQIRELIRQKLKDAGYLRQNDNGPRQLDAAVKSWKMEHGGMAEAPMESMLGGRGGLFGNNPEEVANTLKSSGIPGIRYLDAGSRGTGQGTHNYVVFDDALIEILKRNGVPVEGLLD